VKHQGVSVVRRMPVPNSATSKNERVAAKDRGAEGMAKLVGAINAGGH
jgi:hypothetical protein